MTIDTTLKSARTFVLSAVLLLPAFATAFGGTVSDLKLFPETKLSEAEAVAKGYRSVDIDLGSPALNFKALVRNEVEANVVAKADALETPGREVLATLFAPQDRDHFAVTVSAFSPGFAAEAPTASEQLLFEGGYNLADAQHEDLVSGQAFGLIRENGAPARAARSLCATRGKTVLCFVMEFDAEYETEAMEQAAMFAGSLAFADSRPNAFDESDLATLPLALPNDGTLALQRPSAWVVAENGFSSGQSGALQMHHGEADNPFSVLVVTASEGQVPTSSDALETVAKTMVDRYVEDNAGVLANPELASITGVRSAGDTPFRSYAFIADKPKTGGQAQLRLTLMAFGGLRYAVLLVTEYSEGVDESGAFFVRWSGTTAEDLTVESILKSRR